jgi:DNA methylase
MNNIFEPYIKEKELYVNPSEWANLQSTYPQEFIIKQVSDSIELFNIKLPYREISLEDAVKDYVALCNLNSNDLIKEGVWVNKFDYKYSFLDKYIDISNTGNKASDYFHQIERWKCDATGYPSPQKTWETERFRLTLFKALFSLKVNEINPTILRSLISLRKYIAAQFRPSVAKVIYDYFQAENVLDFSMGWGDRLVGAHASEYVKKYTGIDPNINLFENYKRQIEVYDEFSEPFDNIRIIQGCAEDENIILKDEFDLIFTSPPYFDKEKYDQSDIQSYKKYKEFDNWMNDFLFKSISLRSQNLKSGGYLVINISDIYTRKKRYYICDGMNDYITSTNMFEYIGAIGLRMPKRPMSISSDTVGVFAEPVWIYRKK